MSYKRIFKFILLSIIVFLSVFISFNLCKANQASGSLVINEIVARTTDGSNDWIELYVDGNDPVYLGDFSLVDDTEGRAPAPLPDIVLGPGEFFVIQAANEDPNDGSYFVPFKLGADDSVTLYWGDNIIDVLDWEDGDAPEGYSYGRLPDGTGEPQTLLPTPNAANEAPLSSTLVINEILAQDSNGGNDWIELYVDGNDPVYLGDCALVDDKEGREPAMLPDITLNPGEFFVIQATDEDPNDGSYYVPFKLGADDSVTLYFGADVVDILDWMDGEAPSGVSYGLLPDGKKGAAQPMSPTPGAPNRMFNLFETDKVVEVRLELTDDAWQAMLADPMAEEYQPCNIVFNGIRLDNVAVRTKGQSSLMTVAMNPDSNRYSFKVDINYYVDQDLFGLQKINLNNGFSDPTFMREYLSYHLMQEMGIPSPHTAFVNLYINDELFGLYLAVEAVDDEFVEDRFDPGDGDLYKAEMWTDLLWKGDSIGNYSSLELKTNEDTSDHSALLAMLYELNNGSDYESFIDVDEVLRYLAVSTALTNLDSYQGVMAQNYYLYEDNGVFSIIPWDFNMSFGGYNMGCDRASIIEFMIDEPTMSALSDRPLIAKLLQNPDYLNLYHGYINQLITGPFAPENMDQMIDETADLIREYVYADPTKFFTTEEFEQTLTSDLSTDPNATIVIGFDRGFGLVIGLKAFVHERVASISDQLNGLAPASGDGSGNCDSGFMPGPGQGPGGFGDAIATVAPPYAYQGDMNVAVTINLIEEMQQMLPAEINLLSVKIGSIEGKNIGRNGLEITALFDIPVNEPVGMKDVTVEFEPPEFFDPNNQMPQGGMPPGGMPPGGMPPGGGFGDPNAFMDPNIFGDPNAFMDPNIFGDPNTFMDPNDFDMIFTKADAFEIKAQGGQPAPSGIESVSPSYATQADTNVAVTITLSQDMAMLPSNIIPLSVKIGQLDGSEISRDGLQITAAFNIPANEPTGMKDVSIALPPPPMDPNAQPMILTKADAFEIKAQGGQPPLPGIESVSPSSATQADTDVAVTITLSQDMAMLPPNITPLYVKIGQLTGSDIARDGLQISAVFDIPANEPTGIKDVFIALPPSAMDPNAQPMILTKADAFEIIRGYLPFTIGQTTADDIVTDIPAFSPGGLYDETILRTIYLEFSQEDWWQQLEANYYTEENILADLTMDGNTYYDVGIRFKGMTSYTMTGNSQKKSFNIEIDATDPDQRLMGYKTLNLNNASMDPSFIREVLYFNIFRKYAPCPQANFVKLVINGENWGIYVNAQQQNSDLIEEWFGDNDGNRWKVGMAGGPGGFPQFQSLEDWLAGPSAEDLNNDGQINEVDFDIYIQSQTGGMFDPNMFGDPNMMPPGGGMFDPNMFGDPNMMPGGWGGGGMFDPNFTFVPPSLEEWLASPMAQDMNSDGQITEEDYNIFINRPSGGGMFDPNMFGDPNMMPPGGGMFDPNMFGDPNMMPGGWGGGMMFGGGNGALTWLGSDVAAYEQAYELKSEHTTDPWAKLIAACDILNNTPLDQLGEVADSVLAVDRWLWFLAMENIFTDEDSYLTKGWDYQIYYDPKTGQIHPLQHDGNETFVSRFVNQSPFEGEGAASRPLISRLMAVPQFRERYLAHIRTIVEESLDWDVLTPRVQAYRALIANEVQADTKKLYSYDAFEASFTDIENFVNNRRNYLLNYPEINKPAPEISSVVRQVTLTDSNFIIPGQPVWIIATVQSGSDIEQGILYYTAGNGPFEQVPMFFADVADNPGDVEILVAEIPPFPAGSLVRYYVEVRTADDGEGNSFAPYNAEDYIFSYRVYMPIADYTPIVINELMASNETTIQDPQGDYDDWIELINISDQEIDLSGMYLSDNEDNPLKWEIPEGIILAPGAYLIVWADEDGGDEPGLHANFKLSASGERVLLVDKAEHGNSLLDSVEFGDQETDMSFGRYPNGTGEFMTLSLPTPNDENYLDNDGDGYSPGEGDCNDDNPAINPGAFEIYDGLDNDCDGLVDEDIEVIAKVSPSSGKKGDDITVIITLIEEMATFLPDMDLLSVKIGSLAGIDIALDGLKIKALFNIPANEKKGMYDVSVMFQGSDGQTIIFAKSDAFEVVAGNTFTPGNHYGWYIGNHYGWFNPLTPYTSPDWFLTESPFGFGQKTSMSTILNEFISELEERNGLFNFNKYKFKGQSRNDLNFKNQFGFDNNLRLEELFQNGQKYPYRAGFGLVFESWFDLF